MSLQQRHANVPAGEGLSTLLGEITLLGADWVRLHLGPADGYRLPAGEHVAVHIILAGSVELRAESGPPLVLQAGASALLPRGRTHAVAARGNRIPTLLSCFDGPHDFDIPPTYQLSEGSENSSTVLTGLLRFSWPSAMPEPRHLPLILLGTRSYDMDRSAACGAAQALSQTADLPGANICLSRFAELLLTRELGAFLSLNPHLVDHSQLNEKIMATALAAVRAQPEFPWSVESLARHIGMSRSSFAAKFSAMQCRTPMEAVTEIRLALAARFLRETSMKVKEIAAKVGYLSDAAFTRSFSKSFGISPAAYRRGCNPADWISLVYQ